MIELALIGVIVIFIVIAICTTKIEEDGNISLAIILLILACIGLEFICVYIANTPTALDVYEGNTELRITYEGKVPVDSVVIFKKKVHETE